MYILRELIRFHPATTSSLFVDLLYEESEEVATTYPSIQRIFPMLNGVWLLELKGLGRIIYVYSTDRKEEDKQVLLHLAFFCLIVFLPLKLVVMDCLCPEHNTREAIIVWGIICPSFL
jgi:hypothetical protein